ncbi:hypothetical protein [Pseudodesulfovibrio senegalensis]|uniref:AsmA-like C-terminal domain-containing protein n=1 Tax=Pseudodesulfovibrio senegalensis TaxID=1721087 RepID=A0A6N6N408_9BACT|nr:hypothetical protein [Pseudodesulfovibrio senegalensis]KAB1442220.1 hypothetical protein F8A88_07115 [Pseudodesulfovibrio senegalensis]
MALLVAALPSMVSSGLFHARICAALSRAVAAPVSMQSISWGWGDPLVVKGIAVQAGDVDAFQAGPVAVDSLRLGLAWPALFSGIAEVDLRIAGVRADVDFSRLEETRPDPPQSESSHTIADTLASVMRLLNQGYSLPVPVRGFIRVEDMDIRVRTGTHRPGWQAHNMTMRIDAPDPVFRPVAVALSADLLMGAEQLGTHRPVPLAVGATFVNTAHGTVVPSLVKCNVDIAAPGLSCTVKGSVATGLALEARADLGVLFPYASPLIGGRLPELSGHLRGSVSLSGKGEDILFETMTVLEGLRASGGGLPAAIGPLDLRNTQQGVLDVGSGMVQVDEGSLEVADLMELDWNGRVRDIYGGDPVLELSVGPISADMHALMSRAVPFVSDGSKRLKALNFGRAEARANMAVLSLHLADGHGRADLVGGVLEVDSMRGRAAGRELEAHNLIVSVAELSAALSGNLPVLAEVRAGVRAGPVTFGQDSSFSSLDVPRLDVRVEDSGNGLAKGVVRIAVQGECRHVGVPSLPVPLESVGLDAEVDTFFLASRRLEDGELRLRLNGGETLVAHINELKLNEFDMHGQMRARLDPALAVAANLVPEGSLRGGPGGLAVEYDGRLPDAKRLRAVAGKGLFEDRLRHVLAGVRSLRAELNMESLDICAAGLELRGLRLPEPLLLTVGPRGDDVTARGALAISDVGGLPGVEVQHALPVNARFSADIGHCRTLGLKYDARLTLLGLEHQADVRVPDMGRLLDAFVADGLGGVLQRADLDFSSTVSAQPQGALPGEDGVSLAGGLQAGISVRLAAGRSLALECRAKAVDMQAEYGNRAAVNGLNGGYSFARTYRIAEADAQDAVGQQMNAGPQGLSRTVLAERRRHQAIADDLFARRVNRDLRGSNQGMRTLDCDRFFWAGPPVPVALDNVEMQVSEDGGIPSMEFFQFGTMGGSVQGGVFVKSQRSGGYAAAVRCAFTGLDADELLPQDIERLKGEDTELSGQLAVDVPLSESPAYMLENTRVRLDMTHIGTRTLERLLRSLDPQEANRTIVDQRRLLRMGTPRNVCLRIANGNLSLSGEVVALGIRLDLPRLTRFNLAGLPVHDMLAQRLAVVGPVVRLLNLLTADELQITPRGTVRLVRTGRNMDERGGS